METVRIWGTTKRTQKIRTQHVANVDATLNAEEMLEAALEEICRALDVPRPVLMSNHMRDFAQFGRVRFAKDQFVEPVPFDMFEVEQLREGRRSSDVRNQFPGI